MKRIISIIIAMTLCLSSFTSCSLIEESSKPTKLALEKSVYEAYPDYDNSELLELIDQFLSVNIRAPKEDVISIYGEPDEETIGEGVALHYNKEFESYDETKKFKAVVCFRFSTSDVLYDMSFSISTLENGALNINYLLKTDSIIDRVQNKFPDYKRLSYHANVGLQDGILVLEDDILVLKNNNGISVTVHSDNDANTSNRIDVCIVNYHNYEPKETTKQNNSSNGNNNQNSRSDNSGKRICAFDGCNAPASWGDFCDYHRKKMNEYWDATNK
ncbi:hypothetical protein [Ruminococcus sp. NK3A76]|uniref:hypothetical protein n=1 Tax=Ruminococcus sp. NK3A76 TaxID=877411 RepID=UPI00048FB30A|nr:hypothetical protein [Ruminococcus sp. NK3A76]